jgi:hypothetical protein
VNTKASDVDNISRGSLSGLIKKDNETKISFPSPPKNNKTNCSFPSINLVIKKTDKIHDYYRIVGHATHVLQASGKSLHPQNSSLSLEGPELTLKGLELVLKVSWPEA